MTTYRYYTTDDRPDIGLRWLDGTGAIIDLSSGYTFTVKLVDVDTGTAALTKSSGITGAATSPNVTIAWATGELAVTAGVYRLVVVARHTGSSKDMTYAPGAEPTVEILTAPS